MDEPIQSQPLLEKKKIPLSIWRQLVHCVLYSTASIVAISLIFACFIICEKGIVDLLQWAFSDHSYYAILALTAIHVMSAFFCVAGYLLVAAYGVFHACRLCLKVPKEDD